MTRPMERPYSLARELAWLRPLAGSEHLWRRYTEEELREAEARLDCQLPPPIRSVYLWMADLLLGANCLRPLELLRWDHDCLGFFYQANTGFMSGICRRDNPNALYVWREDWLEDAGDPYVFLQNDLAGLEDALAVCQRSGDEAGRRRIAASCARIWARLASMGGSDMFPQRVGGKPQSFCTLDGYSLFTTLSAIGEWTEADACQAGREGDAEGRRRWFALSQEAEAAVWSHPDVLAERLASRFVPLSAHTELLEQWALLYREEENRLVEGDQKLPLLMAYRHVEAPILLFAEQELGIRLLSARPLPLERQREIEGQLGVTLRCYHRSYLSS